MSHPSFSLKVKPEQLLAKYKKVRAQTKYLCEPLEKEDFVVQPTMDVSPPKWHLAHTTWFFETFILSKYLTDYLLFDKNFPYLFNSYYISAGDRWSRAQRGHLTRPTVDQIFDYRAYVDQHIQELFDQMEFDVDLNYLFEVGLNHEQQHQELLLYDIKYILGNNPLSPIYRNVLKPIHGGRTQSWLELASGVYEIGYQGEGYKFDNELGVHKVFLNDFAISSHLVSNKEYLDFIHDGGYQNHLFWLSEGWDWVNGLEEKVPLYWQKIDDAWFTYAFAGLEKLDLNEPVSHISFYEADAFARWKGLRLPTEFEWEIACKEYSHSIQEGNFVEGESYRPLVDSKQFYGNLWQWTSSAYRPYPYFEPADGALGEYNGKVMINTMVLRGGSYATPRDHIRPTYRNFFHPNLQWMFSGIRLAKDL
jgi:ergothioneine biosynthesis protein EgtB